MKFVPAPFLKIPSYRKEADPVHFAKNVVCLEKIDGSNTRIGVPLGAKLADDIIVGGRTRLEIEKEFSQPLLRRAFLGSIDLKALIEYSQEAKADLVLYGETCGRGIQPQGQLYGSAPHFLLFGATVAGAWLSWSTPTRIPSTDTNIEIVLPSIRELAKGLSIPTTPMLYQGPAQSDVFEDILERPSEYARSKGIISRTDTGTQEGMVIWADPILLTGAGQLLVAKYKHPSRRESVDIDQEDTSLEAFCARVVNSERIKHAQQYLEENGRWVGPLNERLGLVVRRVLQDVAREESSYHEMLGRYSKQAVRAAIETAAIVVAQSTYSHTDAPEK